MYDIGDIAYINICTVGRSRRVLAPKYKINNYECGVFKNKYYTYVIKKKNVFSPPPSLGTMVPSV